MKSNFAICIAAALLAASATATDGAALAKARLRQTGGVLEVPATGMIAVLDAQGTVPREMVDACAETLRGVTRGVRVEVRGATFSVAGAKGALEASGAAAAVFVVDDPALPMSLVAMEEGWGAVNIVALKDGGAGGDVLAARLRKEFVRVASVVFSGAKSQQGKSLLQTVRTAADLDRLAGGSFAIDAIATMMSHLSEIGVKEATKVTYRSAVQQGWAPAPTNDLQRAIWDEVKGKAATNGAAQAEASAQ